jgi:hypothetical protein
VLIVDRYTLRTVNILDLIYQVNLGLARAKDTQNLLWINRTKDELLSNAYALTIFDLELLTASDWVRDRFAAIFWRDDDLLTFCIF